MKINKSEYEKKLDDKYWEGIEAGIKFTLHSPNIAIKYVDNIPALRITVKNLSNLVKNTADAITRLFELEKSRREYETDSRKKTDREDD